jgi:hypothetical protein
MVNVEARNGGAVVVSNAETGKGHPESGWDIDEGVNDGA